MLIRLADVDRKRLGVDVEWIDGSFTPITVNQAITLQHEAGYRDGPEDLRDAWNAQFEKTGDGYALRAYDYRAVKARVWLAVNRAGCPVTFANLDFDLTDIEFKPSDADEGESGKDESTPDKTSAT